MFVFFFPVKVLCVASSKETRRSWSCWTWWSLKSRVLKRPASLWVKKTYQPDIQSDRAETPVTARPWRHSRVFIVQVSCWISLLIPKIEDGNDFGVAIQVCSHAIVTNHRVTNEDRAHGRGSSYTDYRVIAGLNFDTILDFTCVHWSGCGLNWTWFSFTWKTTEINPQM